MADINANDVFLYISEDEGVTLKLVVCLTEAGASSSKSSTTVDTRCGTKVATGNSTATITGTATLDDDPQGTDISGNEIWALHNADTEVMAIIKNVSGSVYRAGTAKITDVSDTYTQGNLATFNFTATVSGLIDVDVSS